MILDNARVHHAKLLKPFLDENKDRLELMFLPAYSPELNLIEGLQGWLKSSIINNIFFESIFKVKKAIIDFIENINKAPTQTIDRLCVKMQKLYQNVYNKILLIIFNFKFNFYLFRKVPPMPAHKYN